MSMILYLQSILVCVYLYSIDFSMGKAPIYKAKVVSVTRTRHNFSFNLFRAALGHGGLYLAEVT